MPEVSVLIDEIIKKKPDIDKEKLYHLINEKKKKVGAGYLTDSGAAFLVASDMNIPLEVITNSELPLKELYIGANEVSVIGRVLTINPTRKYNRKDGTEGSYRRLVIFDEEEFITITLWNDKVSLIETSKIDCNDIIKIKKGYVKSGLDGKPILHIGNKGEILKNNRIDENHSIPSIDKLAKDVSLIKKPESNLVLNGIVYSYPRLSNFIRKDGRSGELFYFFLNSTLGRTSIRVSIWNNISVSKMKIEPNSVVRLIGFKSRMSSDGSIEIHGNEGAVIQIISTSKDQNEVYLDKFRLLSIGKLRIKEITHSASLLVTNKIGNYYTLILRDEATKVYHELRIDSIIDCRFKKLSPTTLICDTFSSIKILDKDIDSIPKLNHMLYKIGEIADYQTPVMLEVIALSRSSTQDIISKKGENLKKSEVIVGDETKEIKLVAWRELSDILFEINAGQRLRLIGVIQTKGFGDIPEIQIKSFSQIEKIS
jgi:replication factor A1